MALEYQQREILIWGKTYPELSKKYFETVCTAGVLEDGRPVRLYPITFRYLSEQFKLYQWMTAEIAKNPNDPRPESYRIDCDSIRLGDLVPPTSDEWGKRAELVFRDPSWQFASVENLLAAQKQSKISIGVVSPREIINVEIRPRTEDEQSSFKQKFDELRLQLAAKRRQLEMFEQALPSEMKRLEFLRSRVQVFWKCHGLSCAGHRTQVLDWGLCELQRRQGDDAALAKMRELCNIEKYSLKFFLGNLFLYPSSFMIVGLWYPRKAGLLF